MHTQTEMFITTEKASSCQPIANGQQRAEKGMQQAADHAEQVQPNWQADALEMLRIFIKTHSTFMVEEVREFAESGGFEIPPSKRAWGAVVLTASRLGWIEKRGIKTVNNPKAHCANATLWGVAA